MSNYKIGDLAKHFAKSKDDNSQVLTEGGKKVANLLSRGAKRNELSVGDASLKKISNKVKKKHVLSQENRTTESSGSFQKKNKAQISENESLSSPKKNKSIKMFKMQSSNEKFKKKRKRDEPSETTNNDSEVEIKSKKRLKKNKLEGMPDDLQDKIKRKKNKKKKFVEASEEEIQFKKSKNEGKSPPTLQFGSKKNQKSCVPGLNNEPQLMKFSAKESELSEDEEVIEQEDTSKEADMNKKPKTEKSETDKRTLFFGNIPLHMDKAAVGNIFKNFGALENVRFRSYIPVKKNTPRKFAERRKECHENVTSHMGFVVFKNQEDAKNALQLNGTVVNGNHIRVDWADFSTKHKRDYEYTVFVGNLPFNVSDEAMWSKFASCGDIMFVRVIRDNETGRGKGFGYVRFKDKESVQEALQLDDTEIEERNIRVKMCEYNKNAKKNVNFKGSFRQKVVNVQEKVKYFKKTGNIKENNENSKNDGKMSRIVGKNLGKKKFNRNRKKDDLGISQGSRKSLKKMMNKKRLERKKKKIATIWDSSNKSQSTIAKLKTTKSSM